MAGGALSFREDPFRLTPDRRYIFETDGFRQAFAMLLAGIRARRGAMLLTGPSGTGKTTLLQGLLAKLQQDGAIVFWRFHPDIPGYDLIGSCLAELEVQDVPAEPEGRARALVAALRARAPSQAAILIVDEAGQFADAQLTELAALPAATGGGLQLVLAGLPAVADRLESDAALAPLNAVIALRAALKPLGRNELGAYIAHRCRVAGQAGPLIFSPEAIGRVFDHTGGTPRLVNRLCATALFFADSGAKQISATVVDEAARACAGEPTEGSGRAPEAAAAPPAAETSPPPAIDAAPSPPAAPQRPVMSEAQSEVHRTLAEAERAWISGRAAPPVAPPTEASAPEKQASPSTPAAPAPALELTTEMVAEPPPPAAVKASPPTEARKRSSALRIAASVALVAASAAALMAVLWPTPIGREYLAGSAPARAVARLFVAQDNAPKSPVVAEAVVPPEPAKTEPIAAAPTEPQAEAATIKVTAAIAKAEPIEVKPEPVDIKPEPVAIQPDPLKTQRAEARRDAPVARPEPAAATSAPILVQPAPVQETPIPVAAQPEPISPPAEMAPGPSAAAVAAPAADPVPPSAAEPPRPVAIAESVAPPAPPSEPVQAIAAALAAIAPANGPTAEPVLVTRTEDPPAPLAPVETAKAEPAPVATAAIISPSNPPASPAGGTREIAAAPTLAPPPVTPSRAAQASLPAADPAELQQLMTRGDEMMRLGDPASARLFYERAAARGLARAFTAVGRTYDPLALQRLAIRGGGANSDQALAWYRRGSDAGDGDAARATGDLNAWLARPR